MPGGIRRLPGHGSLPVAGRRTPHVTLELRRKFERGSISELFRDLGNRQFRPEKQSTCRIEPPPDPVTVRRNAKLRPEDFAEILVTTSVAPAELRQISRFPEVAPEEFTRRCDQLTMRFRRSVSGNRPAAETIPGERDDIRNPAQEFRIRSAAQPGSEFRKPFGKNCCRNGSEYRPLRIRHPVAGKKIRHRSAKLEKTLEVTALRIDFGGMRHSAKPLKHLSRRQRMRHSFPRTVNAAPAQYEYNHIFRMRPVHIVCADAGFVHDSDSDALPGRSDRAVNRKR